MKGIFCGGAYQGSWVGQFFALLCNCTTHLLMWLYSAEKTPVTRSQWTGSAKNCPTHKPCYAPLRKIPFV